MIKVLHVVRNLHYIGGTERFLNDYFRYCVLNGRVQPIVGCLEAEGLPAVDADGDFPVYSAGSRDSLPSLVGWLVRLVRRIRPDVIHTHLYPPDLVGALAARLTGTPLVSTKYSMFARGYETMSVVERVVVKPFIDGVVQPALSRMPDHVACVSAAAAKRHRGWRRRKGNVTVVPCSPVRLPRIDGEWPVVDANRADYGLPAAGMLVGTVARLVPEKGLDLLLEVAATLIAQRVEVAFAIAGGGPLECSLRRRAEELGVAHAVHLLGELDDVYPLLQLLDVFIMTSLTEGLPVAIQEALSVGLPVVAVDVGGIRELLEPAGGVVVKERSPEQVSAELRRVLLDERLRAELSRNGPKAVASHFSLQIAYERMERIYDGVVR